VNDLSPINLRPRRLRSSAALRSLVRETEITARDFILPLFVTEEKGMTREEIASMPGVYRHSIDSLRKEAEGALAQGIGSVLIFGIPEYKDELGSSAYDERGIVQRAVKELKRDLPGLVVITDVCLCEYTSHGHCGVINGEKIDNDPSLAFIARTALSHAIAGADIVAPSDMMDGRVGAIRTVLDEQGYLETPILSYAAKYASAYYGPFREAAGSAPQFGDRRTYQMDPANRREALKEVALDIAEGADMIMVKPALAYLDIVRQVRDMVDVPVVTYNVSGEYSMVKAAAANGWIDERSVVLETLTSMKRAGADIILTYHARDAARWLKDA